jgi:hypothetical protein
MNVALILSCIALLLTIAAQDFWYAPLRNETVSSGLTGPYHVLLDASYIPLAAVLCFYFNGQPWPMFFAVVAAVSLLIVAASNTAWRWFDTLTDGEHTDVHSSATLVVFISALMLQMVTNHGWHWWLTVANVLVPVECYFYFHYKPTVINGITIAASPAAEKLYITGLCVSLIALAAS